MAMPACCNNDEATIRLPLSKSIEARRLVLAAVHGTADAAMLTPDASECADIQQLKQALQAYLAGEKEINVGSSGTALRFMTALAACTPGREVKLDATEQLRRRPLAPLIETLRCMGADIASAAGGHAPLQIKGGRLAGDRAPVQRLLHAESSQYLSALMLVEPLLTTPLPRLGDDALRSATSAPYLLLTRRMTEGMTKAEADWSAASYFYLTALLTGRPLTFIPPLTPPATSLQGDSACAEIFRLFGVSTIYEKEETRLVPGGEINVPPMLDMHRTPDLVPAVAVASALTRHPLHITGIAHLSVKESNRLKSITTGLRTIGAGASVDNGSIRITGTFAAPKECVEVDCCDDHRIAMAFTPASVLLPAGLRLKGSECVTKSFPHFFSEWNKTIPPTL